MLRVYVARSVGQNEVAAGRRKVAVGHVDRDTLLALVLESVGQKTQVELGSAAFAACGHGVKLVNEH